MDSSEDLVKLITDNLSILTDEELNRLINILQESLELRDNKILV